MVEFHQILRLFNTEPNRPRASPAIFKHVGQVPYSRGFKFGEKGPIKILVHFGRQVRYGRISSNFTSFQHRGRSPTQGASNLGKRGRSKFWSILAVRSCMVEFHQILRLFNTEPNRPRASPATFKHVGQVPYSRGFKFG